jgi:hypothetical protein
MSMIGGNKGERIKNVVNRTVGVGRADFDVC